MKRPSMTIPGDVLDDFDEVILQKRARGELPKDASRSQVVADLMQQYVDDNRDVLPDDSGKRTPANTVLAD